MLTIVAIVVLAVVFVLFFLVEPRRCTEDRAAPFCRVNYAHRGLHTKDHTVPENSLAAFRRAADAGYGIELDLRLSKDGEIVIFHDDTLQRICGAEGRPEDRTAAELTALGLWGTEERVPLFRDVLDLVAGRVPLLVELKSCKCWRELCRKAAGLLDKYEGPYCIESFDPRLVGWFSRHRANVFRGQLISTYKSLRRDVSPVPAFVVSMAMGNFLGRPHFISHEKGKQSLAVKFCHWLGAKKFVWTVRDTDDVQALERQNDSVIFEFYEPRPFL